LKQTQPLAAAAQPLVLAAATNTSTGTTNNNSSTSTSTTTGTGTSTSTSSSTNNISISSGNDSNKVYLNRILYLGLLYGFMGLSLICFFSFFWCFPVILTPFLRGEKSHSGFVATPPNKFESQCASWESNLCSHSCGDIAVPNH